MTATLAIKTESQTLKSFHSLRSGYRGSLGMSQLESANRGGLLQSVRK